MTLKGAGVLLILVLLLGGLWVSTNPTLKHEILTRIGLANYAASAAEVKPAGEVQPEEFERGPQNGRLLRNGKFSLEVTIFETGVPPEFRFYVYENDKQVSPADVDVSVALGRLGGIVDRLTFTPEANYLKSTSPVIEPHSFDVSISARHAGATHEWKFSSYEGRTAITEEAAKAAGMLIEKAGPVSIRETVSLSGTVVLNQNKTSSIRARFPGVVTEVKKNVGDTVAKDEVIAMVDSNNSLQTYPIKAPFDGVVLERNTNIGDVAGDAPLYLITDLSSVWAEFHVFSKDLMRVKAGQAIKVKSVQGEGEADSKVTIFTPIAELSSQSVIARVTLPNGDGAWRPGMTVRGDVLVAEHNVPLAVKTSALQRFRDFTVVFAKVDTTYEVRMLELGLSDGQWTEVKEGLKPGTEYVTENSFLVKADIEKSGASHDH